MEPPTRDIVSFKNRRLRNNQTIGFNQVKVARENRHVLSSAELAPEAMVVPITGLPDIVHVGEDWLVGSK